MPEIKTLLIRDLDGSFQIRANGTNSEKVQQYCEMFREYHGWGSFPPLTVVSITDDDEFPPGLYIADGIHRYQAALLANVGIQEVKCEVWEGGRDLLYDKSLAVNAFQGLGMSTAELRAARKRIIKDLWPTRKYSTSRLAEICHCSDDTIRNDIKKLESEGVIPTIEFVIGADGKEYPTKRQKPVAEYSVTEKPATPAIPHEYCAREGCGTPIWDDMKKAADCTYIESGGRWFCSEECARAYFEEHPEPWAPPDDGADTDPVIVGETVEIVDEDEPPARVPAPSSSQASGEEPEQEEPTEFAFNDVDAETLPVYTAEPVESTSCGRWIRCYVEVEGTTDPEEALRIIKAEMPISHGNLTLKFDGLNDNINNQNLNNNININHETFTEFFVNCRGKKGPVKVFISRKKYEGWRRQFGPSFDIDQNLRECCDYYNELTGSEMLSAGGVYSKVYAWLLKNWKLEQKQSRPKQNAYKDAGLVFDPSNY